MRARNVYAYGVLDAIYYCDKGEQIPWHDHKHQKFGHGHFVIRGKTLVEVEGEEPQTRTPEDPNIELDWERRHQVTALEDGTIFSHRAKMEKPTNLNGALDYGPRPQHKNRVLMADGTIVEID